MSELAWRWPDGAAGWQARARRIAEALDVPPALGEALASRKLDSFDPQALARRSLAECTDALGEPIHTEEAAARLLDAARDGSLGILCDFDVDGATSQAILTETCRAVSGKGDLQPAVAVPERNTEGFGPNQRCLDELAGADVSCIAVVDCGTAAGALLDEFHKATGIDVVVIDHHPAHGAPTLQAGVLLNPWESDPPDPGEHGTLCAAGLTWFVARSILRQAGMTAGQTEDMRQRITLYAALGTSCDMMPVDAPFNRALVRKGARLLDNSAALGSGLAELCKLARISQPPSVADFGWRIGPRLNAGSRMKESDLAARCLRATDRAEAQDLAKRLDQHNRQRRELGEKARAELAARADAAAFGQGPVNVTLASAATPGTVGLVASELVKAYGWPAIALAERDDGSLVGSGRSALAFDVGSAVVDAVGRGIARKGGGHASACGVEIEPGRLDDLRAFLAERFAEHAAKAPTPCEPSRVIDAALGPGQLGDEALLAIADAQRQLEPWGQRLEAPLFGVQQCRLVGHRQTANGHVFAKLECQGQQFEAAWWSAPEDWAARLGQNGSDAQQVEVAGAVRLDTWDGRRRGQFVIADARVPPG